MDLYSYILENSLPGPCSLIVIIAYSKFMMQ